MATDAATLETATRQATGENIRRLREAAGLTQRQLAERCGEFDSQMVSRWERGEQMPELRNLSLLAWELQVGIADLLDTKGMAK